MGGHILPLVKVLAILSIAYLSPPGDRNPCKKNLGQPLLTAKVATVVSWTTNEQPQVPANPSKVDLAKIKPLIKGWETKLRLQN